MDKNKIDPFYEGQIILIKDIQDKLENILKNSEGVDLLLDVINLLKEIRPVKKKEDK